MNCLPKDGKTRKEKSAENNQSERVRQFIQRYFFNDKTVLTAVLTAGSKNNINPNLFVDALKLGDDVDFCEILKQK